jgi:hypothetical protein
MTIPPADSTPTAIDGIDVDAVAAAVQRCPGVASLDSGRFGEVGSYLPGRRVPGVVVSGGRVTVQIRSQWGIPAASLAALITAELAPLTGHHPVDVVIADIDDPPEPPAPAIPADRSGTAAGRPA